MDYQQLTYFHENYHSQWELYIPSELAYGDRGSPPKIGGGDVLIFQMEILAILGDTVPALKCSVETQDDCNDKEKTYIAKVQAWTPDKVGEQLTRIRKILASPMKDELRDWARRRQKILEQLFEAQNRVDNQEL